MNKIHFLSEKLRKELQRYLQLSQNPDVLTMDQLDGFLFCLSISSPFISPSVIIASIFGTSYPVLDSLEDVYILDEYIAEAQNQYARALNRNRLVFPYNVKENNLSDVMIVSIQDWCYGFIRGILISYRNWFPPDKEIIDVLQIEEDILYTGVFIIYMIAYVLHQDKLPVDNRFSKSVDVNKFANDCKINILTLPEVVKILVEYGKLVRDSYLKKKKLQRNSNKNKKINRNDPCPCGSGKKYKKCCGSNL